MEFQDITVFGSQANCTIPKTVLIEDWISTKKPYLWLPEYQSPLFCSFLLENFQGILVCETEKVIVMKFSFNKLETP